MRVVRKFYLKCLSVFIILGLKNHYFTHMDPVSIFFFALASIIGIESNSIVSQKATITINPTDRTFEIHQEDLFAIIMTAEDSFSVEDELRQILEFHKNIERKNTDSLTVEEIVFTLNDEQLNTTLKGSYFDSTVLEDAGIYLDKITKDRFYLMNFPDWNIRSSDAVLKENYWSWPVDKTVTIIMEPFNDIPDEYRQHRRSILTYWKQQTGHQSE